MKKILLGLASSCLVALNAQVSDFENFNLPVDTFINGSSTPLGHTFVSGDAEFHNYYDTAWGGYWTGGWAISSMTDTSATNYSDITVARPAEGGTFSPTYAVGQQGSKIVLTGPTAGSHLRSMHITNTNNAYVSMRDGDTFAKKFGGASGNDPDFFLLTIEGYYNGALIPSKVEFYLADFRDSDNSKDYIVDSWQVVDLYPLGNVDSLMFTLTSSDTGSFGMNTPSFFAIDNFNEQFFGIDELETPLAFVYPNPAQNKIWIETENQEATFEIISLTGQKVVSGKLINGAVDVTALQRGLYILNVATQSGLHSQKISLH